jgi:hypothetical protein
VVGDRPHARPPAHRCFDTTHAIIAATVRDDLPELRRAIGRLLEVAGD